MMEFILSRVWMVIAGLTLTAVVIATFNGMDQSVMNEAELDGARTLADLITEMEGSMPHGEIYVSGSDLLTDPATTLVLRNGSLWVDNGRTMEAIDIPVGVGFFENGTPIDRLIVRQDDTLKISTLSEGNGTFYVQVEKVEATSFTASTNLSHSSMVL